MEKENASYLAHQFEEEALASTLLPFAALVFSFVAWAVLVVVFFPRLLGRVSAFISNRTTGGQTHVSISTLHVYPLAGRIVAHSVRFTNVNFTATVEECVLQFRWWRGHEALTTSKEQILSSESPEDFHRVVLAQQQIDQENSEFFLKRLWYKLKRWWHRSAVAKDPKDSLEPAPLVSFILVGLHVRVVNNEKNHSHVASILKKFTQSQSIPSNRHDNNLSNSNQSDPNNSNTFTSNIDTTDDDTNNNQDNNESTPNLSTSKNHTNLPSNLSHSASTISQTSQSSVATIDEKPFFDSVLELSSLRINDAAVYVSDMGQSPLLRFTFDTAKLRYRYGAADCPADLCRKIIVAGVSSLRISIASQKSVESILKSPKLKVDNPNQDEPRYMKDNTEKMVERLMSLGYEGIHEPLWDADSNLASSSRFEKLASNSRKSMRASLVKNLPSFYSTSHTRQKRRELRRSFNLVCTDIFHSTRAVIEYVFDEPGLEVDAQPDRNYNETQDISNGYVIDIPSSSSQKSSQNLISRDGDSNLPLPPPVCRVSVLCKGADAVYDMSALSDLEEISERLSPNLYDYLSQATEIQTKEGKRLAKGLQIQVNATPKTNDDSDSNEDCAKSIFRIPFKPQRSSWIGLLVGKIREKHLEKASAEISTDESTVSESNIPHSFLDAQCSKLSILTEIPYVKGSQRKLSISMKKAKFQSNGISNIPLIESDNVTVTKITNQPEVWNEEVLTTTEIQFSNSDVFYAPDFMRIITDISTTVQEQSRKPPAVNYFIPSKEIVTIRAKDNYCINLSCGRDNAWKDVMNGLGDEYGNLKLKGQSGELHIAPPSTTQYNSDSSSMSWSLSLPNVCASLQLSLPSIPSESETPSETEDVVNSPQKHIDPTRSTRVRAPSLARRGKGVLDETTQLNPKETAHEDVSLVDIEIAQFDGPFDLKGKSLSHEDCRSFSDSVPTFLDAVNTSDMSFHADALRFDLNPLHFSQYLNLVRNYVGGNHSISVLERKKLDELRDQIATDICIQQRYPDWRECLVFGLNQGFTLPGAQISKPGLDDLFQMIFSIDTLLLRIHELPHTTCPFDFSSQNVSSVVLNKFYGETKSNRLGSELVVHPSSNDSICLYGGCLSTPTILPHTESGPKTGRMTPVLKIEKMKILKHSLATEDWSSYFSSVQIDIDTISGCLMDMTTMSLCRLSLNFIPDGVSESVTAVSSLLSIDSIEVSCKNLDLLVVSASSRMASANDLSGSELIHKDSGTSIVNNTNHNRLYRKMSNLPVPKYLAGVFQVRLRKGFRVVTSSLAFEKEGFVSRYLLPSICVDVFVPSGGKLPPWVDEVTVRAQVAHATIPHRNGSKDLKMDFGVMSRALEVRGMTVEMAYTSRPSQWNSSLPTLQNRHVSKLYHLNRTDKASWTSRNSFTLNGSPDSHLTDGFELGLEWAHFTQHSNIAKIVEKHLKKMDKRTDVLSFRLPSKNVIFISPEVLHLGIDIAKRAKEFSTRYKLFTRKLPSAPSVRFHQNLISRDSIRLNPDILSSDLISLWHEFEKYKQPSWVTEHDRLTSGSSFEAFETQGITVSLLSPTVLSSTTLNRDSLMVQRFSDDQVFISIPSGIHVIKELRFDVSSPKVTPAGSVFQQNQQHQQKVQKIVRTNLLYSHLEIVDVGCNDVSLFKIGKILLINRERNSIAPHSGACDEDLRPLRRDRKTSIAKIDSFSVGQGPADLNTYATFGRVSSIFLLMARTIAGQMDSLSEITQSRYMALCATVMSCSQDELMMKDPNLARSFFVSALKSSEQNRNETTLTDGVSLDSFILPNISDMKQRKEIPTQTLVHSIDATIKNMSLILDDREIAKSDILSCKGGKTFASGSPNVSDLDGYVLNASLGAVTLSIGDDVAARTLRMVGRVASYVQKASLSLPFLRPGGQRESETSSSLSTSFHNVSQGINLRPLALTDPAFNGNFQSMRSKRKSQPLNLRSSINQRACFSRPKSRPISFQTSTNQSIFTGTQQLLSLSLKEFRSQPQASKPRALDRAVSPLTIPSPEAKIHSNQTGGNTSKLGPKFRSSSGGGIIRRRSQTNIPSPSEPRTVDFSEEQLADGYKSVPIRTAGDSGPARKRSRCLVPATPRIPPEFTEIANAPDISEATAPRKPLESLPKSPRSPSSPLGVPTNESKSIGSTFGSLQSPAQKSNQGASIEPSKKTSKTNVTLFISCREFVSRYYRSQNVRSSEKAESEKAGRNITFLVHTPRLTFMSHPESHRYSILFTASSSKLFSSNNPHCVLTGSTAQIVGKVSLSKSHVSSLPKLLASCRVTEFKVTLLAKDLRSVQKFRNEFQTDLKGVLSAFSKAKHAVSEMAKTTRLVWTKEPNHSTSFSAMAFDIICERSEVKLEGFHPNDTNMSISYVLNGIFFSIVASEDDNAALTLGLRLYDHSLRLFSPSWPGIEDFHLPSLDARGVQWSESMGLPTILKVTTDPLVSLTSFQGLRHVLFTVAGLLAFQNKSFDTSETPDIIDSKLGSQIPSLSLDTTGKSVQNIEPIQEPQTTNSSPFTRSLAAWERTKGVRMEISIRPIALSLASGQVVALFDLETVSGSIEWNKLVKSGVQLRMSVNAAKISLCFMRMPNAEFYANDVRNDDKRSSLSIVLEKSGLDLLKKQEKVTHTFIFRTNISSVSGQVRPWRLFLDAAVWTDEQEFVSELQSINYNALSTARQRPPRSQSLHDSMPGNTEHRLILFGANIQRVALAVPLVNSEQHSTSRLAIRATDLHFLARHRFDSIAKPIQNIFEVKSHFIGILWEGSSLLSSHHAQLTLGVKKSSISNSSHFGALSIVMVPGTWRICPRKDVVVAILEAKNRKENKVSTLAQGSSTANGLSDSKLGTNRDEDALSIATEKDGRLLIEKLNLKVQRTSGFIEGLENELNTSESIPNSLNFQRGRADMTAKVSVPAFSISVVRRPDHDFDLIDVDFSGREGEFPRGCLQSVANLFSELFGVVALDQERTQQEQVKVPSTSSLHQHQNSGQQQQQEREISRDMSMFIRFGDSRYKAQEEANLSIESKVALFASKYSALLVSLTTNQVLTDERNHTTVISGVSPSVMLEISPLLDGAEMQALKLADVRFLHGLSSSHAPHTLLHINRIKANMEAKTLLLVQNRLQNANEVENDNEDLVSESKEAPTSQVEKGISANRNAKDEIQQERRLMFVFGKPRTKRRSSERKATSAVDGGVPTLGKGFHDITRASEADILLQLKLSTKPATDSKSENCARLIIERLHIGVRREMVEIESDNNNQTQSEQKDTTRKTWKIVQSVHCATHDMIVRASWDILLCQMRLLENLFFFDRSETVNSGMTIPTQNDFRSSAANIINLLTVESKQFDKRTLKLEVDALAAKWMVPSREIEIESTKVKGEMSHTLFKAITKFTGQWKRLSNEVRLLTERDSSKRNRKVITERPSSSIVKPNQPKAPNSSQKFGTNNIDARDIKEARGAMLSSELSTASFGDEMATMGPQTFGHILSDDIALVESLENSNSQGGDAIRHYNANRFVPMSKITAMGTPQTGVPLYNAETIPSAMLSLPSVDHSGLMLSPEIIAGPSSEKTKIKITGGELVIMMRGYQFDETRHSAMISLYGYQISHVHDFESASEGKIGNQEQFGGNVSGAQERETRLLHTDFKEMTISYNDDERGKRSELFKVPSPNLKLSVRDSVKGESGHQVQGVDVALVGDLEVQLGHGFYNFQEFKELLELTIRGIAPAPPRANNGTGSTLSRNPGAKNSDETAERRAGTDSSVQRRQGESASGRSANGITSTEPIDMHPASSKNLTNGSSSNILAARDRTSNQDSSGNDVSQHAELWDGKKALTIHVTLKPRIDVIGDLTGDVLPMVFARLIKQEQVDFIPKGMFDYMVIPLESFSNALCSPLQQ